MQGLESIEETVLLLSARGTKHGDSGAHPTDVHRSDVSKATISTIADKY